MVVLRALASILLISHSTSLVYSSDVIILYHQVQRSPKLNSISHDQELTMITCPPWKYHKYYNSSCVCGSSIGNVVDCRDDQSTVYLLSCHCMSYSDNGADVVMGACPFLCTNEFHTKIDADTNLSDLCDHDIRQNRQSQMCGQCKDNHSPSPYSYQLKCVYCSNYKYNWLKYLAMAYLPLTFFFLVVIIFRFSALSGSVNAFIFFSQIISCPAVMSLISTYAYFSVKHPVIDFNIVSTAEFMATILGMWNLDFLRMVYKPFCLHPHLSIMQIVCLDYAVAVYPLMLTILTYMLFKLHERSEVVHFMFKPIVRLFSHFHHKWRASNSLIEAFATFILLSYVKVINTSFDILMPTQFYNVSGQIVGLYAYYNGSMEYFGHEHLPYAVLAIFMFITFNLVPLLLLILYPCRCFQSCLNCCRLNSQVLRTFMDAFQGCYKFEPYDYRYWAAFYLFLRIAVLAVFAITQSIYFVVVVGVLIIPVIILAAIIRPYKETVYNMIDVVFLLVFIQICFSSAGIALCAFNRRFQGFLIFMLGISVIFPLVYIIVLTVCKILPKFWIVHIKEHAINLLYCHHSCARRGQGDADDPLLTHQEDSVEYDRALQDIQQPTY